jgi:uncharacterized protein YndB with AHSA1/START domain
MAGKNDDDDIAFTLERWFDAPRDLVWKVYTTAEHLSQWWGPPNFAWVKGSMELKPGGMFHYGMRAPNGSMMWGKFVYREIAAPERIVFTNSFSDENGGITPNPWMPEWPLEVLNTVTFREENGRTLISMYGVPVNPTEAQRQMFKGAKMQMQAGFKGTLDKLAAYLAQQQEK